MLRKKKTLIAIAASALLPIAGYVLHNEGPGFRHELEGLYFDYNLRDLGQSLNACLENTQKETLREHRLFRSNKWFSGWSCDRIERPDTIITLNFEPDRKRTYYCEGEKGRIVGRHSPQTKEINDIEFISTWQDPEQRSAICNQLMAITDAINRDERVLFHCEAGRDRTGAVAALLGGLILETRGDLSRAAVKDAVECDYRKSRSLTSEKFGRMARFLDDIWQEHSTISDFLGRMCGLKQENLALFARNLID